MIKLAAVFQIAILAGLGFLIGCGGSSTPQVKLVPVTGTVTAAGAPLANATITFSPYTGESGRPAYGTTDEVGKYTLTYVDGREGCPVGKFTVIVTKFAQPDGSLFPAGMPQEEQRATGVEFVKPEFSDGSITKLSTEVGESGGDFPFEVELKK